MRLGEIAQVLGCRVIGDDSVTIKGVAEIHSAGPGQITFLTNPKYRKFLKSTKASAVLVGEPIEGLELPQLVCKEPYVAFAKLLDLFNPETLPAPGVSDSAHICEGVEIGKDCYIGPNVYIGEGTVIGREVYLFPGVYVGRNCRIGDGTVLFPGVKIYDRVKIGRAVRIHAGAVVGSDGFGYAFSKEEKKIYKIPQTGGVVIEDLVEIGANTTIDRGTIGDTVIGEGTKIDNLVQIGHNVKIGRYCFIVSQVGISGSTKIGDFVTLAGKVGVAGHIEIASNVTVAAKAGITKSIKEPGTYAGFPARPYKEWRRIQALVDRLPELYQKIKELARVIKR
ncbi:UDP-3-O-(3-hydroxymyristoyl) glucosamine N-acyltransferase [Thermovibrio ammonificans HB-1]|uniref:UDP-3-O-acylglucosamine N-acyltransferase n=1 Tax=Thermovibrio ammonificans (strain DSM 15698 / JCM 12110 / HB-1) TaxID=648996 RepID=E8T305_THEA1|nr:UDP-3-O-(3-hydroxymyristoyl)glucosamine N-acyltransferase [Thermovibrio ammonificans]ADU97214.1 UDP-3-O-(3-hydroxymyristoyl) glucosamine N-acyltransferase [Thermovibrio ammonificans HB-1]